MEAELRYNFAAVRHKESTKSTQESTKSSKESNESSAVAGFAADLKPVTHPVTTGLRTNAITSNDHSPGFRFHFRSVVCLFQLPTCIVTNRSPEDYHIGSATPHIVTGSPDHHACSATEPDHKPVPCTVTHISHAVTFVSCTVTFTKPAVDSYGTFSFCNPGSSHVTYSTKYYCPTANWYPSACNLETAVVGESSR